VEAISVCDWNNWFPLPSKVRPNNLEKNYRLQKKASHALPRTKSHKILLNSHSCHIIFYSNAFNSLNYIFFMVEIDWGVVVASIAVIIAVIGVIWSNLLTRQSLDENKKTTRVDVFLRLQENFSLNNDLVRVRNAISTKNPVLEAEGGPIKYEELLTYLETVNKFIYYINTKVIPEDDVVRKKEGSNVLIGIDDLMRKTRARYPGNSELKKNY